VIALKDNKSGRTYSQTFPEIDTSARSSDTFFWFSPSSPWDEEYGVTVATRESHSSQKLIVSSIQHHIQFATQIVVDDEKEPVLSCRDSLLPASYMLAAKERQTCMSVMKLPEDVQSTLDVYSYQRPDGSLTIRKMRTLPPPSELDELSEDRHISEYQRQIINPILSRYTGSNVLIYFAGGDKSKAYAEEFRQMFSARIWTVKGPIMAPVGNERIIDAQMSVNYEENWNKNNPKAQDLLSTFKQAGIKQRSRLSLDPKVPRGLIVLWIGPRSPKDVSPDQCLSAEMEPKPGEHHACEMLSAVGDGLCPFLPK
jgi:hypothetical protein